MNNINIDFKKRDYLLLTTKDNLTYAGENMGLMQLEGKNGLMISLHKQNILVVWCAIENIKDAQKISNNGN